MDTKIILEVKEGNASVAFEPGLSPDNFVAHLNNALNTIPNMLLNMFATIPLLRPACDREHESHVYVFSEGERGEAENNLYKYRKHLYDTVASVFGQLLSTAFPDIEFIEACKQSQQEYCMTHNEEERAEHNKQIEEVVKYVRDNFDELLKQITEEGESSETEEETVKS